MNKEELLSRIKCNGDPDMSEEAKKFYYYFFPEYMVSDHQIKMGYRGDCIISLGWTFGVLNKTGVFDKSQRSYNRLLSEDDIKLFYIFREKYHSKANFMIIPGELNLYRGGYRKNDNDNNGCGSCDYPDIFLDLIRSYFLKCTIPKKAENYIIPYRGWLDSFGTGEGGWRSFVNRNYLIPFVNNAYEVKDIFSAASSYTADFCDELVGTHHGFDWCLPRCNQYHGTVELYVAKDRVLNFLRNSLWIWEKRAELLSE